MHQIFNPESVALDIYDTEFSGSTPASRAEYLKRLITIHSECVDALDQASQGPAGNPKLCPYRKDASGQPINVAPVDWKTGEMITYMETKRLQSLPLFSAKKRRETLGPLVLTCQSLGIKMVRTAVVASCGGCHVSDLKRTVQEVFSALECFFRSCRRTYPEIELLFASAETPVSNGLDQPYHAAAGLLYHPHIHIIFQVKKRMKPERWSKWMARFKKAMGARKDEAAYVHECGALKDVVAACRYVTKVPEMEDILAAGEFVEYHQQINGLKLMRAYGALRAYRSSLKKRGRRVKALKETVDAGPLWRWRFEEVDVRRHPTKAKRGTQVPAPSRKDHFRGKFLKQDAHGFWREYAVFENPSPGMTGKDLLASMGHHII